MSGAGVLAAKPRPTFDEVYETFVDFVWRSARRLGAGAAVDDIVQEVFVIVHRKLPEFEGRSSVKTWLFSIVLRVVRQHRRSWARNESTVVTRSSVDPDAFPDTRNETPLEGAIVADDLRLLDNLLAQLDDDKREVFVLSEIEQMAATEIAEILGDNLNTVYARLRAARRHFEQALARHRAHEAWRRS